MYGDHFDLRERLEFLRGRSARPTSFMFGSGLSNAVLPSTSELTQLLISETSQRAQDLFWESAPGKRGGALAYQDAARVLALHQGDDSVAKVIRLAVLRACSSWESAEAPDESTVRELMRDGKWTIPDGYLRFADYFSKLEVDQRGAVSTTNFDPFLELALRSVGLQADPLPLTFDSPPTPGSLAESSAIQVLHLHGYFAAGYSLNTVRQLSSARPNTEEFLRHLYTGASVVVLGYGGWEDAFMRVLARHASQQTLANAEVVWAAHDDDEGHVLANSSLGQLDGQPGFQLFIGIDAHRIFAAGTARSPRELGSLLPRAYRLLPVADPLPSSPVEFSQGAIPTWDDASPRQWPQLGATQTLARLLDQTLIKGNGALAAIGPMGEGKSMALRQLATKAAVEDPTLVVLWRETGASPLEETVVAELCSERRVLICIDDADTAERDLQALGKRWRLDGSNLIVLVACQDRLWSALPAATKAGAQVVLFEGLENTDALAIASRWEEFGIQTHLGSQKDRAGTPAEIAQALVGASMHNQMSNRTTLFGAILRVREAKSLQERISRLMESLDGTKVSSGSARTLADVFGSICVLQHFMDELGDGQRGATRDHIAKLALSDDPVFSQVVLSILGREASITYAGNRVYARHPEIAKTVVSWLQKNGRLNGVCRMTATAGGQLRESALVSVDDYDAYMLWKYIEDTGPALAAARGAVEGAPGILESRINFLATARKHDELDLASKYFRAIATGLDEYKDRNTAAMRVFFTEGSLVSFAAGEAQIACGLAALAMHDSIAPPISGRSRGFGISALSKSLTALVGQKNPVALQACQTLKQLATQIGAGSLILTPRIRQLPDDPAVARLSMAALATRLATQLSPIARQTVAELNITVGSPSRATWCVNFNGALQFSNLVRA